MNNRDYKDPRFCLQFTVSDSGILLREFLQQKGISKRTLTATKYGGGTLKVNGVEQNVRYTLMQGDEVEIIFPQEEISNGLIAEDGDLNIVYEDDAIIIIDKPPGKSTIPSRDHPSGTIANAIAGKFLRENIPATVHVVTRLDRDTSGLICIAKNRHIHHLLSKQMEDNGFTRQYEAVVEGQVEKDAFVIEAPIGRKDGSIIERIVREDGQYARTDVRVIERIGNGKCNLTRVRLVLHTGRTHQIRVHMYWTGHSLAGDDLYGGTRTLIDRQALHCATLKFQHPLNGECMEFRSDIPTDMKLLCRIS
ncbi:RluA family pseudouridine synthase [Sporosarcina sp. G11-34]|uniref:RluA family pseudouridine synthase n=1 Tax=Sporosarcina sp. G11-34 TaxID=2849605 RepID=UPI0022A90123|nr:RluA family pseudouridine synthase [Sporosarcina sp. G11-34]MCZ2258981.1 RluA family pseudouridine synthase [Sporosarcina sp. G11-34]